jgi:PAS domain S-box-containing protein
MKESSLLANVLNSLPDLVWLKDTNGKYLACNQEFEKFFGVTEEELIGKDDFSFVNKDLAQCFVEHDKIAMQTGLSKNEEYLVFADGSYEGDFETIKIPLKDEHGKIIGVMGIARDITATKREITAYKKAEAIAHVGSWEINIANNHLAWSDECYRIFGMEPGSKIDYDTFVNAIYEPDKEKVLSAWQKALEGAPYEIDHRIVVNGSTKWVRERANLVTDSHQNLVAGIGTVQDITLFKEYEEKLLCLVNSDQLTGLANRVLLNSMLEKAVQHSVRNKKKCALLLFDLDRFKDINDSFGHGVGDEVLKEVANRLSHRLRATDVIARVCDGITSQVKEDDEELLEGEIIARLGGDEFAIVLSAIEHTEDAAKVANDIMQIIAEPYKLSTGATIHVHSSVGISIAPDHSLDANELLQFADSALYKAKNEGRSSFAYYSDPLTALAKERIEGENRLRQAIENKEFELYYQPQVHIASDRIIGVEALVRWNDPEKGLIPPNDFIPLAEQSGLIIPLGEWVMQESCRQAKEWVDKGYKLHVSFNVAATQLHYSDIHYLIEKALKKTKLSADKLTMEITEGTMMKREEDLVQKLHYIRSLGVKIAIDDFGTGYSSYSYLKRFPIDILKIDKSFIDDIPYEKDNMAIVSAIVAMGHAMNYQILAEGTEYKEQIEFLKEQKCEFYQGYFKGKPMPASELERLLLKS